MSDNKKVAKNAIVIYVRLIVTAITGLLASRYILKALGANDFGLYNVVGSVVTMMAFVNTVMVATTYRYIAFELGKKDQGNVNKIFNTSLVIHIAIAIIVLLFSLTIGEYYIDNYLKVEPEKLGDARFVFWTAIASCLVNIYSIPFLGLLTAFENFRVMTIVEVAHRVAHLVLCYVLMFVLGNRLRLYGLFSAGFGVLFSLAYILYCYKKYYRRVEFHLYRNKSLFKEMVVFSGWTAFGAAAIVGQRQCASVIVNHFFGTLLNAAYGVANMVNTMVSQFSRALSQAAVPQITKNYSGNNVQRSVDLACYISKYTVFFMLIFCVPLLLETDFVVKIWLGGDDIPPYTVIMCQLTLINLIIGGMGEGLSALVQATGKIKWFQIILSTTSLLALPMGWILYAMGFPPYTLIVCFIITAFINLVVRQILLNKLINFDVRRLLDISYFRILYVCLVTVPIFFVVPIFQEGWCRFLIAAPCSVLYTLTAMWVVGTSKTEKARFVDFAKNVIKKR